jgi:hypothetical protein
MVLECDEYYHRDREGYVRRTDDRHRSSAGRTPTVYVRVNPDGYRPSSDLKPSFTGTYGSLGEDDCYIINEWPSQEELDSTVSRAWCTYMYYNDSETREIKLVLM